mmetsp:Transcript_20520/g.37017  ORF Transcript_20520/g.37017 Transcript_20520/m.37017 type:complete len:213 (-) Transcript_20520:505-1143(-)
MTTTPITVALILFTVLLNHDIFHARGVKYAMAFVATPIISPSTTSYRSSYMLHMENDGMDIESTAFPLALCNENIQRPMKSGEEQAISPLLSRKRFSSIASSAVAAILYPTHPQSANADDPSNLYYKSKADEEDPLAVFGKSLQNMSVDFSSTPETSTKGADAPLSFNDIVLPTSSQSDTIPSTSPMGGGDLNKALQVKKESQKRSVNPLTH